MTVMNEVKRPLTENEMSSILEGIQSAEERNYVLAAGVFGVISKMIVECCGMTLVEFQKSDLQFRPGLFQIPSEQWHIICQALMEREKELGGSPLGTVNIAMDFTNYGPSGYES